MRRKIIIGKKYVLRKDLEKFVPRVGDKEKEQKEDEGSVRAR